MSTSSENAPLNPQKVSQRYQGHAAPKSAPLSTLSKDKVLPSEQELKIDEVDLGDDEDDVTGILSTDEELPPADESNPHRPAAPTVAAKLREIEEIDEESKNVDKVKRNIYISRQTADAISDLAKARNVNGSKVIEIAIAMFYKNYFEREFIQISDMEIFFEELAMLVAEQSQEVAHLSELTTRVLDAEMELPTDVS